MTISLKANLDGSAELQVDGVTKLKINADGGVNDGSPCFSAYQSAEQSIPSGGSPTKVNFQTEEFDLTGAFDSVVTFQFQPNVAGYYLLTAACGFLANVSNLVVTIYKNEARVKDGCLLGSAAVGEVSALVYMNGTTDYAHVGVYQSSGAAANMSSAANQTFFQGFLARAA